MSEPTAMDWEHELSLLDRRLAEWYQRFDQEFARLARRARRLFRKPDPERLQQAELEARAQVGEDVLREVAAFLDRLAALYLESLPGERARIRARVGSNEAVFRFFWSFVSAQPDAIHGPEDAQRLRLALAATSIHDLRTDVRAVDEVLGRLWLAAERAGIDPAPEFQAVGAVSNRTTGGGGAHFRERIEGFERSKYFRDVVRPARSKRDRNAAKLAS